LNRLKTFIIAIVTIFLAAWLIPPVQSQEASGPKAVMAYYEWSGSYAALASNYSYINQLATDTWGVNAHGVVTGQAPPEGLPFAKKKGMQTFATVSNFGKSDFSPHIAHAVITNPSTKALTISNLLNVVQTYGYSGVNIDFEAVPRKDRLAFSSFIHDVAQKMRAAGYLTVVSAPAELEDNPSDSWTGAFDFKSIGADADILQLMTYDENGPWGPPGPVAGLDWVEPCVQYAVSVMPSTKVSLGIPAYGYDWNLTRGTGVQVKWKKIPALISETGAVPQWDGTSSSPFFTYQTAGGSSHVVWYENATSIQLKSALVLSYNLTGVSAFALGFDDQSFWVAVHSPGF